MKLPLVEFEQLVRHGVLLAIDLVIENHQGQYFLGKRKNAPAKDFWFVPGGRIYKGEHLVEAFSRIAGEEIGVAVDFSRALFLGVFEHIYSENFFEKAGFGTHYVVLTYRIAIGKNEIQGTPQHSEGRWFSTSDILSNSDVHTFSKVYFEPQKASL